MFCFSLQIAYSLLFSLVIAVISDALSTAPDKMSVLSRDASFRREFQETVSERRLFFLLAVEIILLINYKLVMFLFALGNCFGK